MASLVIKDFPDYLHRLLKGDAERNRRSMVQQATMIIEERLVGRLPKKLPDPVKPLKPISAEMITMAIREGRR